MKRSNGTSTLHGLGFSYRLERSTDGIPLHGFLEHGRFLHGNINCLVSGIPTPSEKYESLISWDDYSQYLESHKTQVGGWPTPLTIMSSSDWIITPTIGENKIWLVVYLPVWKILVNGKDYPIYYGKWKIFETTRSPTRNMFQTTNQKKGGFSSQPCLKFARLVGLQSCEFSADIWSQWPGHWR